MSLIKISPYYSIWKLLALLNQSSSKRDPLNLNSFFANVLPKNQKGDGEIIKEIIQTINSKTIELGMDFFKNLEEIDAMAASRDLNMVASVLTRWNIPLREIPSLENILLTLSKITMEVPTDTVFTYGPRNPEGDFRRVFTQYPEELLFIESFVNGMNNLPVCVTGLQILQEMSITDLSYEQVANEVTQYFHSMIESITLVRRKVSPEVFTNILRPYFDPKIIGGKKYFAPGGAQMPICLMDFILWGIEVNEDWYIRYFNESCDYLPNAVRKQISGIYKFGSVKIQVNRAVEGRNDLSLTERRSIEALEKLLLSMEKFRSPHLKVANDNMKIRPTKSVGSGGYDVQILENLLHHTKDCRNYFKKILKGE